MAVCDENETTELEETHKSAEELFDEIDIKTAQLTTATNLSALMNIDRDLAEGVVRLTEEIVAHTGVIDDYDRVMKRLIHDVIDLVSKESSFRSLLY